MKSTPQFMQQFILQCFLPCFLILAAGSTPALSESDDSDGTKTACHSSAGQSREDTDLRSTRIVVYKAIYDGSYIERATGALHDLRGKNKFMLHVKMYSAIMKAVEARDGFWPARRMRLIEEALHEMEGVVAAAPEDYEFRMLRASTWWDLPSSFRKKDEARAELLKLAGNFEQGALLYHDYLKSQWLNFFLDHQLYGDEKKGRELFRKMTDSLVIAN